MKKLLVGIAAIMAVTGAASAADLGGRINDDPGYASVPAIWTGWAITGSLGHARQEYDTRRTIGVREDEFGNNEQCVSYGRRGCSEYANVGEDDIKSGNAICTDDITGVVARKPHDESCGDGTTESVADETFDLDNDIPFIQNSLFADFFRSEKFDTSGLQGGVELSRRVQNGGWVFEAALGANFDSNDSDGSIYDTEFEVKDADGVPTGDTATGVGSLAVSKNHDIYAVVRGAHTFGADQRLLMGLGAGVTFGSFNIKGSHAFDDDDGNLDTAFNKDETAVGARLEAFARYKITENVDFGVLGTYSRWGRISASDSAFESTQVGADDQYFETVTVNDRASAKPDEWALKGTLTYTIQ